MRRLLRPEMKIDAGEIIILALVVVLSASWFLLSYSRNSSQDLAIKALWHRTEALKEEHDRSREELNAVLVKIDQQLRELRGASALRRP